MDKVTTKQVRNVLMNELGLNREYIRGLVQSVVETVVEKKLAQMDLDNTINNIVGREFSKLIAKNRYDSNAIRDLVIKEAQSQVTDFVKTYLKFEVADE